MRKTMKKTAKKTTTTKRVAKKVVTRPHRVTDYPKRVKLDELAATVDNCCTASVDTAERVDTLSRRVDALEHRLNEVEVDTGAHHDRLEALEAETETETVVAAAPLFDTSPTTSLKDERQLNLPVETDATPRVGTDEEIVRAEREMP